MRPKEKGLTSDEHIGLNGISSLENPLSIASSIRYLTQGRVLDRVAKSRGVVLCVEPIGRSQDSAPMADFG